MRLFGQSFFGQALFGQALSGRNGCAGCGRKGLDPAPDTAPTAPQPAGHAADWPPTGRDADDLTAEGIYARCAALGRAASVSPAYFVDEVLAVLSPAERATLLASFAADIDILTGYGLHGRPETREAWVRLCYRKCFGGEMLASSDQLRALLTLLLHDGNLRKFYYVKEFALMLRLIGQAIKLGGYLTSADCEHLATLAAELREDSAKNREKPHKKALLRKAEAIEKLIGQEISATSLLLERCDGAENPFALGEKPAHYDFWAGVIGATIAGLHDIKDDLQDKAKPGWMKDADIFARTWPAVGPVVPVFGAWAEATFPTLPDFAMLRGYTRRRHKNHPDFADADRARSLPALRERYAPTMDWRWDTPKIPALDVLADLESSQWTALVEHLITGKVAPRPTAAWLKEAIRLADAIGRAEVAQRLDAWLQQFTLPPLDSQSLADRVNVEEMDRTVEHLNATLPDWPDQLAQADMRALGRALAMVAASQPDAPPCKPFRADLIECTDHMTDGDSATRGKLRIQCLAPRLPSGNYRYDDPPGWLRVSIENEALLRGALWLCAEIAEAEDAVALLEAMALASAARWSMGDQGHRSRVVANAAIATLAGLKGADVNAAIYRLSRVIPDRTINMALLRALNRGADQTS